MRYAYLIIHTMTEISIVHTTCKNCVFAQYEGKTQTGCALDYLVKHRENGTEILDAYDNDLEFYIINQKKCNGYRENSWFISKGLSEDSPLTSKINLFKSLNTIGYTLIINFLEIGSSEEDMMNLLNSLQTISIPPQRTVFIRGPEGGETTIYKNINSLLVQANINCKWKIQTMVDDSISNENILHNAINENKNNRFICALKKSKSNIGSIVEKANTLVHDDLKQFTVLTDAEHSAYLFGTGVYRYSLLEHHKDILEDKDSFQLI